MSLVEIALICISEIKDFENESNRFDIIMATFLEVFNYKQQQHQFVFTVIAQYLRLCDYVIMPLCHYIIDGNIVNNKNANANQSLIQYQNQNIIWNAV